MPLDAVVVDGRPGLLWMQMADVSFSEPFFQQTVDRVRAEYPEREEKFVEFDALLQLDKVLPRVEPAGFIFHSSRCGSTLLANACRSLNDSIVLSEPNAIDKLVARFITDADAMKESLYSVFLRAVVNALGQSDRQPAPPVFIKFSCCSISQLERIRRIWPGVPWIFLYRDPVETIVSNVSDPPAWLLDEDHRVLANITGTSPAQVAQMPMEELCARSVGSFFSTANTLANDNNLLLNYNQLSLPAINGILEFFKVRPSPEELERIASGTRIYSKQVSATREFVPDARAKQRLASDLVREMAERWAMQPYQLLEQNRNAVNIHEFN
ncbi:MAG TPA: hypothetical protein VHQ94_00055 [Pyrinomonadaceae bacterium]|jgi:hypothetical protein|nr:hypothetical protein [Pyrinomonadaceae bacterium]